jgi:uncharacterized RDD family membrane protein YckC
MSTVPSDSLVPAELPARFAARALDAALLLAAAAGLGLLLGFGWDWLLLDAFTGATLGKLALGLRVVGPDGGRPSLGQSLIRETFTLLGAIPIVGPPLALAAWVWIMLSIRASPLRQGRHDQLAGGTRVIRAPSRS